MKSIEIDLEGVEETSDYDEETVALDRDELMAAAQLVRGASRPAPPPPAPARSRHATSPGPAPLNHEEYGAQSAYSHAHGLAHKNPTDYRRATHDGSAPYVGRDVLSATSGGYGGPASGSYPHPMPNAPGDAYPYANHVAAHAEAQPAGQVSAESYGHPINHGQSPYVPQASQADPYANPLEHANPYANPAGQSAHFAGGHGATPYGNANGNPDHGTGDINASGYHAAIPHQTASGLVMSHGAPAAPPAAAIQLASSGAYAPASFGPGSAVSGPASSVTHFNSVAGLESAAADNPFAKRNRGFGSWLLVTVGFLSLAAVGLVAGVAATERGRAWLKDLSGNAPSPAVAATDPFDPAAANRALERMEAQASECLSPYSSGAKGRLSVRFGVDGKVKHVNLEGDVASVGELACVRSAFEAAQVRPFTGQEAQVQKAVELTPPKR